MGLIKSNEAASTAAAPFSMADIERAAKVMLLRARAAAERVITEAMTEADQLKQQAREQGLKEGREAGLKEGREQGIKAGLAQALAEHREKLTLLASALQSACAQLDAHRTELEIEASHEVVALALAIAQRVAKRVGEADPSVVIENLIEALRLVVHARDLRIAVHPSQRQHLLATLPSLQLQWPALAHVELLDDATLSPGGCRLYTRNGMVDADLQTQLDRIADDLLPQAGVAPAPAAGEAA